MADLYLRENSLPQLYDAVIVPALTLAEQDRHKGALDPTREEFLVSEHPGDAGGVLRKDA